MRSLQIKLSVLWRKIRWLKIIILRCYQLKNKSDLKTSRIQLTSTQKRTKKQHIGPPAKNCQPDKKKNKVWLFTVLIVLFWMIGKCVFLSVAICKHKIPVLCHQVKLCRFYFYMVLLGLLIVSFVFLFDWLTFLNLK